MFVRNANLSSHRDMAKYAIGADIINPRNAKIEKFLDSKYITDKNRRKAKHSKIS